MNGINKVILVGTLGADPIVNYTDGGICVANLSVATNEAYKKKDSDEKIVTTEWHKVVLWRGLAEVAEKFLKKGSKVYLEGKLKTRKYTDKNDIERYSTEIYGYVMQMLDSKSSDVGRVKANQQAEVFSSEENTSGDSGNLPDNSEEASPDQQLFDPKENLPLEVSDTAMLDGDDLPF